MILVIVSLINFASAEFWACVSDGYVAHYCNGYKDDRTCNSEMGCQWCMSVYSEAEDCYIHGVWPTCLKLSQDCSFEGEGFDSVPPTIIINSPNSGVYNDRQIFFDISLDESSKIEFQEAGSTRWRTLCTICDSYKGDIPLRDGQKNLTFRATDSFGNSAEKKISFFIDSKAPRVYRTNPQGGFADGTFHVEFKEDNPTSVVLHYGSSSKAVNIASECVLIKGKYYCETNVDLSAYDGQEVEYYLVIEDIAGNSGESKHNKISVDTTEPVINNLGGFWRQGAGKDSKYIYFNISITEENFEEVTYNYIDERGRLKEKRLCSGKLKNGICEKKKTFRKGVWDLNLQVMDKAGNSIGVPMNFVVE